VLAEGAVTALHDLTHDEFVIAYNVDSFVNLSKYYRLAAERGFNAITRQYYDADMHREVMVLGREEHP